MPSSVSSHSEDEHRKKIERHAPKYLQWLFPDRGAEGQFLFSSLCFDVFASFLKNNAHTMYL